MTSPQHGTADVGARRILFASTTMSNQDVTDSLAAWRTDLASLVNLALVRTGAKLNAALHYKRGLLPPTDRQFVHDLAGGKRVATTETVATTLRVEAHVAALLGTPNTILSDEIRALEIHLTPPLDLCAPEVSDAEDDSNYPLDRAQKMAEREPTPTRWLHVWELCREQMYHTRRLMDAAALKAFGATRQGKVSA